MTAWRRGSGEGAVNGAQLLLLGCVTLSLCGALVVASGGQRRRDRRQVADRVAQLGPRGGATAVRVAGRELPGRLPGWLRVTLLRADYVPDGGTITLAVGAALLLGGVLGWQVNWVAGFGLALLLLAAGPVALRLMAARRIAVMVSGMPFFIDSVRQMLISGVSLQQALGRITAGAEPGMRRYLQPMARRMQNGAAVGDSLVWLADRLDLAEMHMFAAAVQANLRYGGRLSNVLGNLANTLRDRERVTRELRAATAETRVSAWLIGALPAVAFALMCMLNPKYATFFFTDPTGHRLLAVALGLQILGVVAIRRLLRLDY
jgi:tight adherence protein B